MYIISVCKDENVREKERERRREFQEGLTKSPQKTDRKEINQINVCHSVLILCGWPLINQCIGNTEECKNSFGSLRTVVGQRMSAKWAVRQSGPGHICVHTAKRMWLQAAQTTCECVRSHWISNVSSVHVGGLHT